MEFVQVNLSFRQDAVLCQCVHHLSDGPLRLLVVAHQLALQGQGKGLDDRRIHHLASAVVKPSAGNLVGYLVAGDDAKIIRLHQMLHIGNAEGKGFPFQQVRHRLVVPVQNQ